MNKYLTTIYLLFFSFISIAGDFTSLGKGHKVNRLLISENGQQLVSIHGGVIDFWDIENQKLIKSKNISRTRLICVDASDDLDIIVMGNNEGVVFTIDKNSDLKSIALMASGMVSSIKLDENNSYAFAGTDDGTIYKIDIAKNKIVDKVKIHKKIVTAMEFNITNEQLISSGADGKIIIYESQQLDQNYLIYDKGSWIRSLSLSDDGRLLYAGMDNGKILQFKLNSANSYKLIQKKKEFGKWITGLEAIQKNNLSGVSISGKVKIWFKFGTYKQNLRQKIFDVKYIPIDTRIFNLALATEKDGIVLLSSKEMKFGNKR